MMNEIKMGKKNQSEIFEYIAKPYKINEQSDDDLEKFPLRVPDIP